MTFDRKSESGFTLVEMLASIMIEAIIVGALGMAFVGILNGTKQANESFDRSGDARIAANYIASDARNSSGPEVSLTDTTSCPDPAPPVAGAATPVVRFNWSSTGALGGATTYVSNYVLVSHSLLRRVCQNGTLIARKPIASNVVSAAASCLPIAYADCTGTPTSITVMVTSVVDSAGKFFQYGLTGSFRKLNAAGAPVSSNPRSVVLLGAGATCSGITNTVDVQGGAILRVFGDAFVNAGDGASCKAMNLGNGGAFQAGTTKILQGGSCGGSGCPTTISYTPAVTDPYANVTAPIASGASLSGCAGPGYYPNGMSFTSGTCTLTTGVYVVKNGFSVSNNASVATGAGGVLIYLMTGQFNIGSAVSVVLTAMATGAYSGISLWQAAADTQQVVIGNGAQTVVFNGALYAPKAQLNINGGVQPKMTTLVVQTVTVSNGITVSIGTPSSPPLAITGPATPPTTWTVNRTYPSTTLTSSGGDGFVSWSVSSLPPGMAVDANTGVISGTPTATGTFNGTITLADALGDIPDTAPFALTIVAVPVITTAAALPTGEKALAYNTTLANSGGTSGYTWSIASGALPTGLALSSAGVISGTPTAAGSFTPSITVTDAAGATDTNAFTMTINPQTTIASVVLANAATGGTAGNIGVGDTITVTFSNAMNANSFCSAWTNGSDGAQNADNQVTVSVSNASPDTLTVTSTGCTFNFGSITLGSTAYVSVAATFKGIGTTKSTIQWTEATRKLVIKLGAKTLGTTATVASSAPTYVSSAAIRDSLGGILSPASLVLGAAKQF